VRAAAVLVVLMAFPASAHAAGAAWVPAGDMGAKRYGQTATLLPSGKVLVAGGIGGDANITPPNASAELFDPATRTWKPTGSMSVGRYSATATPLKDGRVLVAGGMASGLQPTRTAEIYDPATGAWQRTGDMAAARAEHSAALLPGGRVLVVGANPSEAPGQARFRGAELFDPSTGTWSVAAPFPGETYQSFATTLADGSVLTVGAPRSPAARYLAAPNTWAQTGPLTYPDGGGRLNAANALLPDGSVLLAGGTGPAVGPHRSAEVYRLASNTWSATGEMNVPRWVFPAVTLPSGKVLVEGGHDGTHVTSTAELYDPATGAWSLTASMASPRHGHTATLLPDGTVLVTGGFDNVSTYYRSAELYVPGGDTSPPTIAISRTTVDATSPAGAPVSAFGVTATDGPDRPTPTLSCRPDPVPVGDSTLTCTAVDQAGNTATASFQVHVRGALEQLDALVRAVRALPLATGFRTPLVNALTQAREQYVKRHDEDGCRKLADFDRKVEQGARKKQPEITAAQAAPLLSASARIARVIPC
jgi:hypothetical protein